MFAAAVMHFPNSYLQDNLYNYSGQPVSSCFGFKKMVFQGNLQFSLLAFIKKKK